MLFRLLAITAATLASAAVTPRQTNTTCTNPPTRKEWRSLSEDERNGYIKAVHCLATSPSRIGLSTSLYDDFPYVHNVLNNDIHAVASFLPWHRYFVHVYEQALRDCGYQGTATYWDWTLDASDVANAPMWDPVTGFGGNGDPTKTEPVTSMTMNCVTDGPFSTLRPAYMTDDYAPHCLSRNFNNGTYQVGDMLGEYYTAEAVAKVNEFVGYNDFRIKLEGGPHGAVHAGIGGDMAPSTSPNDPIFFLHHTQIDRLWYIWQQADPATRNFAYGGYKTQDQFNGAIPPPATVDDLLPMLGLAEDLPVNDLLNVQGGPLCYTY